MRQDRNFKKHYRIFITQNAKISFYIWYLKNTSIHILFSPMRCILIFLRAGSKSCLVSGLLPTKLENMPNIPPLFLEKLLISKYKYTIYKVVLYTVFPVFLMYGIFCFCLLIYYTQDFKIYIF